MCQECLAYKGVNTGWLHRCVRVCMCVCAFVCAWSEWNVNSGDDGLEAAPDEFVQITHWVKSRKKRTFRCSLELRLSIFLNVCFSGQSWKWLACCFRERFIHPDILLQIHLSIQPSIHLPICLFPLALKGSAWMCWQAYRHLTQVIYTSLTANASCHLFVCYNADLAPQAYLSTSTETN